MMEHGPGQRLFPGQETAGFTSGGACVYRIEASKRLPYRVVGEPLRWGISPSSIPAFLGAAGYRAVEEPTPPSLRERFLDPIGLHEEPLAPYEHLTLAEVLAAAPHT